MKECDDDIFAEPEVGKWEAEDGQEVLSGDSRQEQVLHVLQATEDRVEEKDCLVHPQDLAGVQVQVDRPVLLVMCLVQWWELLLYQRYQLGLSWLKSSEWSRFCFNK